MSADLEIAHPEPLTVDGIIVDEQAELGDLLAGALRRRGIDPGRLADDTPVLNPRGNVLTREEAVDWLTKQARKALGYVADGEFTLDRLPADLYEPAALWVQAFKDEPRSAPILTLRGTTGCGKTTCALGIVRDLVFWHADRAEHFSWYFITHRKFAAAVQPGSGRDPDTLMHRLMTADLVVFDDLGDYNNQDFGKAADYTARLINHRAHHHLPTVYDTNLPFARGPKVLQQEAAEGRRIATLEDTLDGRVISRLRGGWVATMPEVDHRLSQGRRFPG